MRSTSELEMSIQELTLRTVVRHPVLVAAADAFRTTDPVATASVRTLRTCVDATSCDIDDYGLCGSHVRLTGEEVDAYREHTSPQRL